MRPRKFEPVPLIAAIILVSLFYAVMAVSGCDLAARNAERWAKCVVGCDPLPVVVATPNAP
jgi:hypothetical protein